MLWGSQMPNGDYHILFHLNRPQERKRLKQFYCISLIANTYVQVEWDEMQKINNKVPTQIACVHRMLKKNQTQQNKKTHTPSLFTCPFDECLWHYSPGKDQYLFPKTFI